MTDTKKMLKTLILPLAFVTMVLFVAVVMSISVSAEDSSMQAENSDSQQSSQTKQEKREKLEAELKAKREKLEAERKQREAELKTKAEERKAEIRTKLESTKLENCKKREAAINRGLANVADRRTKQFEMFNKVSDRTQKFYTDNNLNLDNYDILVSDVNAKKASAESAINKLKTTTVDFKCDGDDPVGAANAYKAAREEVVIAMKEYRNSIKNLISGVKAVSTSNEKSEG